MDLVQLVHNLTNIDAWEVLIPIIEKHLPEVEKLNRQQLNKGLRADGTSTPSHSKSPMTEMYLDSKMQRGVYDSSIFPSMNLYNTGSFQRKIKASIELMYGIEIESLDYKAEALEEEFGSTIYGLTEQSLKIFIDLIIDEFRESLLKHLQK